MRKSNIRRIYLATLVIGIAYGISISLTSIVLDAEGFTKKAIGGLAAVFASGIVLASLPVGSIVRRISARATLMVAILGYACAVTIFPWPKTFAGVGLVRFVDGACSVGIWVSSETVLLAQSEKSKKAHVTSIYAIAMSTGYVIGPLIAHGVVKRWPPWVAFAASGIITLGSLAIVAGLAKNAHLPPPDEGAGLAKQADDSPNEHSSAQTSTYAPSSWGSVLWRIKTACFATFSYGYFQASVVLFLPLYLMHERGIPEGNTILVTAFFAAGMLLFSNIAGRIGDKVGHLAVMRVLASIGLVMILGFVYLPTFAWMCAAVFVAGATLASLSPLSIALQGLAIEPKDYSRGNSIYNALYAAGMLVGPPISSVIFDAYKGPAMLYHLAALWLVFVIFTIVYANDDPARSKLHMPPNAATTSSESSPA